jgi:hypothetical protein
MNKKNYDDLEKMGHLVSGASKRPLSDFYTEVVDLLEGKDFALAGGLALMAYLPPRLTEDVDFVVLSAGALDEKLLGANFIKGSEFELAKGKLTISRYMKDDRLLDLLIYKDTQFVRELMNTSNRKVILGKNIKVLSANGIALTKLMSFRLRDQEDLIHLMTLLDRAYLEKWTQKLSIPAKNLTEIYEKGTSEEYLAEKYPTLLKVLKDSKK